MNGGVYKWIPCEKELPPADKTFVEFSQDVIVWVEDKSCGTHDYDFGFCDYDTKKWHLLSDPNKLSDDVVAWAMPPKEYQDDI